MPRRVATLLATRLLIAGLLALASLVPAAAAPADDEARRQELARLFTVHVGLDQCELDVTEGELEALEKAEARLILLLNWSDADADAFYAAVEDAMEKQGFDQLCADPLFKDALRKAIGELPR